VGILVRPYPSGVSCAPKTNALEEPCLPSGRNRAHFDREYVERLQAGDFDTERHFTRYFGDLLAAKLRSRLRSAALVDDAKQETFLRVLVALRERGGLETPESLGAFVNAVCNNVLFEIYRRQSKLASHSSDEGEDVAQDRPDAETVLMGEETQARVRQVLSELPPKDKDLLNALFMEELDKDEICRRLGVDRSYLRVLLHRAKARFRAGFLREEQSV